MKKIKLENNRVIEIFGVRFTGVNELKQLVRKGGVKCGVYVGADEQRYPCFDAEDYGSERRFFSNFVFAQSKEELEQKLSVLKSITPKFNYRKYTAKLAPMIYWQGDKSHPMEITECDAVFIPEKSALKKKNTQPRPEKTKLEKVIEKIKQ